MPMIAKSTQWMLIIAFSMMLIATAHAQQDSPFNTPQQPLQVYFTHDVYRALPGDPIIVNTTTFNFGDVPLQDVTVQLSPLSDGLTLQYNELFTTRATINVLQANESRNHVWSFIAESEGTYELQATVLSSGLSFIATTELVFEPFEPQLASYRDGIVSVTNDLLGSVTVGSYIFGDIGTRAVVGDWNGDGYAGIGIIEGTELWLRDGMLTRSGEGSSNIEPDQVIEFAGIPSDAIILTGDFNGNGADSVAFYGSGIFFIYDYLNDRIGGVPDAVVAYNKPAAIPLVGDWDNDGIDTVGLYQAGVFELYNDLQTTEPDVAFLYGPSENATPIIGDWDGDGFDTIGVIVNNTLLISNRLEGGSADATISLPPALANAQLFVENWKLPE